MFTWQGSVMSSVTEGVDFRPLFGDKKSDVISRSIGYVSLEMWNAKLIGSGNESVNSKPYEHSVICPMPPCFSPHGNRICKIQQN